MNLHVLKKTLKIYKSIIKKYFIKDKYKELKNRNKYIMKRENS